MVRGFGAGNGRRPRRPSVEDAAAGRGAGRRDRGSRPGSEAVAEAGGGLALGRGDALGRVLAGRDVRAAVDGAAAAVAEGEGDFLRFAAGQGEVDYLGFPRLAGPAL